MVASFSTLSQYSDDPYRSDNGCDENGGKLYSCDKVRNVYICARNTFEYTYKALPSAQRNYDVVLRGFHQLLKLF